MRRRLTSVLVCAAFAVTGTPAGAEPARPGTSCWPDQARVWRIRRQGTAARTLDATVEYRSLGNRTTVLVTAAEPSRGRWRALGPVLLTEAGNNSWGGESYPYVYGGETAPVTTPDRPSGTPACEGRGSVFRMPAIKVKATTFDWFVAAVTAEVTIKVNPGWTVTELKPNSGANLRIYRNEDGRGPGAVVGGGQSRAGVEHFKGVSAPGGRYGSVAHARLPCDPDTVTAQRATGWGAARLLGGGNYTADSVTDRNLTCDRLDVQGLDKATGATTWTVQGEAMGASVALNRLTVFDFPKP